MIRRTAMIIAHLKVYESDFFSLRTFIFNTSLDTIATKCICSQKYGSAKTIALLLERSNADFVQLTNHLELTNVHSVYKYEVFTNMKWFHII